MKKILLVILSAAMLLMSFPIYAVQDSYSFTSLDRTNIRLDSAQAVEGVIDLSFAPDGKTVVEIAPDACSYEDIKDLILPATLEKIGQRAFLGCSKLEHVVIPDSVAEIGDIAFAECFDLTSVVIPNTVETIGEDAFADTADGFYAVVYKDSAAYNYCLKNGIEYKLADEDCEHAELNRVIVRAPRCYSSGLCADKCKKCGILLNKSAIPETGHNFDKWQISDSVRTKSCILCGAEQKGFKYDGIVNYFDDIESDDWYWESALFAKENGFISGMTKTSFGPDNKLTRAMAVTILAAFSGKNDVKYNGEFSDVDSDSWYANAVAWANKNSIAVGDGVRFMPEYPLTREQFALMLYKFSLYMDYNDDTSRADLSAYNDNDEISFWAKDALSWANERGIIGGMPGKILAPKGTATRAESATMIYAFTKLFEPARKYYDRVVFIGVDGAGAYFEKANTPNIDKIFDFITYDADSDSAGDCVSDWTSILYGMPANKHLQSSLTISKYNPSLHSPQTSIMGACRVMFPDCTLASFTSRSNINFAIEKDIGAYLSSPENGHDDTLTEILCEKGGYLENNDPKLLFIQYNQCELGAQYFEGGYGGRDYMTQLTLCDGYIGDVYRKYEELGRLDSTLFVLISDHGGVEGTSSHNSDGPDTKKVTFAAGGFSVNDSAKLNSFSSTDAASVILDALGVPMPGSLNSKYQGNLFK